MSTRKVFSNSITPLPVEDGIANKGLLMAVAQPQHKNDKMTIHFSVGIPDDARQELENRVANGEIMTLDELNQKYAPEPGEVDKLMTWLQAEGFEIVKKSNDSTGVYAKASVAQIEKSLQVNMVRVTREGITYNAAANAPSLPSDVGENVHAINGLQPFRQAQKKFRRITPDTGNRMYLNANLTASAAATVNMGYKPPYMVTEILSAYNALGLPYTGAGQTIAILIDTFPSAQDVSLFWQYNGIYPNMARIQPVNVFGVTLPPPDDETTLDTEWSSGIAPNANIRIYATSSLQYVYLDYALDQIMKDVATVPGLNQLSISLGLGETAYGAPPSDEINTQAQKYLRLAALGINTFVSSGDAGSNPNSTGHSSSGPLQVEYASSDPHVIGVGGTSMYLSATGTVAAEVGWTGSGGGRSTFFSKPAWQVGNGIALTETQRLVPDVSAVGDPNTGAFLVLNGQPTMIGGTSWSTPVWAAFCALINEARASVGKPKISFLNPHLYKLLGTSSFRDITQGSNGAYSCGAGYDMVTGLGVPNMAELIKALMLV